MNRSMLIVLIVAISLLFTICVVSAQTVVSGADATTLIIQGQVNKTTQEFIPVMTAKAEWYRDLNEPPVFSFDLEDGYKHKCLGYGWLVITPGVAGVNQISTELNFADGSKFNSNNLTMDQVRDREKQTVQPRLIINLSQVDRDFFIGMDSIIAKENNWSLPVLFFLSITTTENVCYSKIWHMDISKPDGGDNFRSWPIEKLALYFGGASYDGQYVGWADMANKDPLSLVTYYKTLKLARTNDPEYNEVYPQLPANNYLPESGKEVLDVNGQKIVMPKEMPSWMMESFLQLDEKIEKIENGKVSESKIMKIKDTGHFYLLTSQPLPLKMKVNVNGVENIFQVEKNNWNPVKIYNGQEDIREIYFIDTSICGFVVKGTENAITILDAVPAPNSKYIEQQGGVFVHNDKTQILSVY